MNTELGEKLRTKYAKLFAEHGDIACGDGWHSLLDALCALIQLHVDNNTDKMTQIRVIQVKEKFGGLRFYYSSGDSFIDGVVSMAEEMSTKICDVCGHPGKRGGSPIVATRCLDHDIAKEIVGE